MDEKEKQAILHQEALQKQAAKGQSNGGFSGAIDDIRHKVVEEPYWLRPEGRATTDDIAPKMRDFYESAPAQESDALDAKEQKYTLDEMQAAYNNFMDVQGEEKGRDNEQSLTSKTDREIGL